MQVDFGGADVDFEYGKGPFSDCVPVSNTKCYFKYLSLLTSNNDSYKSE